MARIIKKTIVYEGMPLRPLKVGKISIFLMWILVFLVSRIGAFEFPVDGVGDRLDLGQLRLIEQL